MDSSSCCSDKKTSLPPIDIGKWQTDSETWCQPISPQALPSTGNTEVTVELKASSADTLTRAEMLETFFSDLEPLVQRIVAFKGTLNVGAADDDHRLMKSNSRIKGRFDRKEAQVLPERLIEMIIARMPYPSLFKARVLSRTWYFKFPLMSEFVRFLPAFPFQDLISTVSNKWTAFCPIFFTKKKILGFDRALFRWKPVVSLSYLSVTPWKSISCAGSLVCVTTKYQSRDRFICTVTNVLTRSVREISLELDHYFWNPTHVRLYTVGSEAYKVIVIDNLDNHERERIFKHAFKHIMRVSVYDSASRNWTRVISKAWTRMEEVSKDDINLNCFFENAAFVNGKFIGFDRYPNKDKMLLCRKYNVEENKWSSKIVSKQCILEQSAYFSEGSGLIGVLLFGEKIMVCMCSPLAMRSEACVVDAEIFVLCTRRESILICELDDESLELKVISKGPPQDMFGLCRSTKSAPEDLFKLSRDPQNRQSSVQMKFTSNGTVIYFGRNSPSCPVLIFDLHTQKWGCLPIAKHTSGLDSLTEKTWGSGAFEPGLNPFVPV